MGVVQGEFEFVPPKLTVDANEGGDRGAGYLDVEEELFDDRCSKSNGRRRQVEREDVPNLPGGEEN